MLLLSPSAVLRFIECPEKFWLSLECKPLPLKTDAQIFGLKLHEIIATYYSMLLRSESVTPSEFEPKLMAAAKKCGISEQLFNKYKWHFKNFIKFEMQRVSWHIDIKPIAVEQRVEKPPFKGIIDAIFRKGDDIVVVDWKSGFFPTMLPDYYKIQGCIYKYLTGASEVLFYFLRNGSYHRLQIEDCEAIEATVKKVLDSISRGIRYRKEGEHCKVCEYQLACHYNSTLRWLDEAYWVEQTAKRT
jgi:CRISPR/Cas system-associated exonuclease Cas4 (RecB family)